MAQLVMDALSKEPIPPRRWKRRLLRAVVVGFLLWAACGAIAGYLLSNWGFTVFAAAALISAVMVALVRARPVHDAAGSAAAVPAAG